MTTIAEETARDILGRVIGDQRNHIAVAASPETPAEGIVLAVRYDGGEYVTWHYFLRADGSIVTAWGHYTRVNGDPFDAFTSAVSEFRERASR